MMAELEIDQSNLPRVQEVCQCFAVLEDGALAHNLQEQEIEQYYSTNVQKNQLVQNDIRVAKRLQDEEEEERAQQSTLLRQASRQLEMDDFEYARIIQDEIQRGAEETRRREQEDEEIARRMQDEETQSLSRVSRGQEGHRQGSTSPRQHTLGGLHQGEAQYPSPTTRWQCSTSHTHADLTGPLADSPRGLAQKNTTSWSNQGHTDYIRGESEECVSQDSEDSDTFYSPQHSVGSQRLNERRKTAPPRRRAPLHQPRERNYRSLDSGSSLTEEERGGWTESHHGNGDRETRKPRNLDRERNRREVSQSFHSSRGQDRDCRSDQVRERRSFSRSESVRIHDGSQRSHDLARTRSYTENPDKRVRFQEHTRSSFRQQGETARVWAMLGQVLRERGVPVRFGSSGAPLQIRPQSADGQALHGREVSRSDSQPHQRAFRRAAAARHSFHGDIRERRRCQESGGRDHREDGDRHGDDAPRDGNACEVTRGDSRLAPRERGGSGRWREHRPTSDNERNANDPRVERTTSQRRCRHKTIEERLSSEEEEEEEEEERPCPRAPRRTQSLSSSRRASSGVGSRRVAAGAPRQPEPGEQSLDMGELRQVLQDEELAHKLQEDEDRRQRRRRKSHPSPCSFYPEGDFRVAQVAQDEEIARFMQKQEVKAKRRSRELEGSSSWREHRAAVGDHDRRAARDRPVQRERLDSEGLPSPAEDCSPENRPPSPFATLPHAQHVRNIAEELDPTFQARRQSTESLGGGPAGPTCQSLPRPQAGLRNLLEEATFIPPTKRQTDKSGRAKPKEKKENCKQQ
ncbi:coiled-coil domain-containing protein 187 isoform X2 [Pseudoliparis swirei]|uniref:coiled-coil domain-containing protein 187 isoform X2 n=1 Tax=Pseudoliparis swirei TaxID=2059687 RepID=UPI0024BD9D42|nr:coiled-coil domain-containing protein 187 isoform X2 [Pseudoliparis swirei]